MVYKVPCGDCPSTYACRPDGKDSDAPPQGTQTGPGNSQPHGLCPCRTCLDTGHDIVWLDAQVIDASPLLQQRCTLESWHIRKQPQPLNRERGMLPTVYDQLIYSSLWKCVGLLLVCWVGKGEDVVRVSTVDQSLPDMLLFLRLVISKSAVVQCLDHCNLVC